MNHRVTVESVQDDLRQLIDTNRAIEQDLEHQRAIEQDLKRCISLSRAANSPSRFNASMNRMSSSSQSTLECYNCGAEHPISTCTDLKSLSLRCRALRLTELRLCHNCLLLKRANHVCSMRHRSGCPNCGQLHNSLLCPFSRNAPR